MTGRLPMRHGLLRPPMYGEPGGLQGEVTIAAAALATPGYVTQAVGKWHMGENVESQPQNVGFDDFYGFLSVSDMYTEWRDPYFFPEIVYSEERTQWVENQPFNKCFVHATRGGELENVEEVTIPVLSLLDDKWADYSLDFIRRMGAADETRPWFLYHCTRGAHFDNYPHERFLGIVTGEAPVQGHDHRARRHRRAAGRRARGDRPARGHDHLHLVRQRPRDGDLARRGVLAVPLRKGSTWEGGQRVPGIVTWPGMIDGRSRVSDGLFSLMDLFPTLLAPRRRADQIPTDRYIDGVDQTSFLLARPTASRTASTCTTGSTNVFSALRVGEWKFMVASTSDDDHDVLNLGGFTGVTQKYTYGRLYNLYLDPKETRSYMIRKLAYIDSFTSGLRDHFITYGKYPPKHPIASMS